MRQDRDPLSVVCEILHQNKVCFMVFCVNECDQGAIVLVWAGFLLYSPQDDRKNRYFCILNPVGNEQNKKNDQNQEKQQREKAHLES